MAEGDHRLALRQEEREKSKLLNPSLVVRRINAKNAEVAVPVPERIWKGRAADGTPRPVRT